MTRPRRAGPGRRPAREEARSPAGRSVGVGTRELRRQPVAAPQARTLVAEALGETGSAPDDDAWSLVVTELVANAVEHGRGRRIWIRVEADRERLLVEVENRCWTTLPRRRLNVPDRPSGRGLALVAALSRRWGVVREKRGRTRVWAEIPIRPEGGAPA